MNAQTGGGGGGAFVCGYEVLQRCGGGGGSGGIVYKARRRADARLCALKRMPAAEEAQRSRQQRAETRVMRAIRHPHIVGLLDAFVHRDMLYIAMDWAAGGDLKRVMDVRQQPFAEAHVWKYFYQLCQGLDYMHSHAVLHRDIKAENVLLDSNDNILIGDLGLGRILEPPLSSAKTYVGTPLYLSPEIVLEQPYDAKSDIWALGCLVHELLTMSPPFIASNQVTLAKKIVNDRPPPLPDCISNDLRSLVLQMLSKDARARPSASQLLNHPAMLLHKQRLELEEKQKALLSHYRSLEADLRSQNTELRQKLAEAESTIDDLRRQMSRSLPQVPKNEGIAKSFEPARDCLFYWAKHDARDRSWSNSQRCKLRYPVFQLLILFKKPRGSSPSSSKIRHVQMELSDCRTTHSVAPSDPILVPGADDDDTQHYYICDVSFMLRSICAVTVVFEHPDDVLELRCVKFDRSLLDVIATRPSAAHQELERHTPTRSSAAPVRVSGGSPSSSTRFRCARRRLLAAAAASPPERGGGGGGGSSLEHVQSLVQRAVLLSSPAPKGGGGGRCDHGPDAASTSR